MEKEEDLSRAKAEDRWVIPIKRVERWKVQRKDHEKEDGTGKGGSKSEKGSNTLLSSTEEIRREQRKELLERAFAEVKSIEDAVKMKLEQAESSSDEICKKMNQNWLSNVQRVKSKCQSTEQDATLSHIKELTAEGEKLIGSSTFLGGLTRNALEAPKMVGKAFQVNMDQILAWLTTDEQILTIGIHGMGGVGKTALAIHIHDKLLQDPKTFGPVYWIRVFADPTVFQLQDLIAQALQLDLSKVDYESERAAELERALMTKGRCILIIDDLWNYFSKEKVGIPVKLNGCRLILTSRSAAVCAQMDCKKQIKVMTLDEEEAWNLFMGNLEIGMPPCSEIDEIAESIVKKCAGLPLGIITMAGSLRGIDDKHEWRNVLKDPMGSKVMNYGMNEVFKVLRRSYYLLNNQFIKQCLLYCALYPEDYMIRTTELIEYLIVEGIIGQMGSRKFQYSSGHSALDELQSVSLLEGSIDYRGNKFVKMHKLVRDMALRIMNLSANQTMVSGRAVEDWNVDLVEVSLTDDRLNENSLPDSPNCPNLETLLLCRNGDRLTSVADSFFRFMGGSLRVLDLSFTDIEELPKSISLLRNLTALLLRECCYLKHIPSLAELITLEKLDLFCTVELENAPEDVGFLTELRYLNFCGSGMKEFPPYLLADLQHLQFLGLPLTRNTSKVLIRDLVIRLKKLEKLFCHFYDVESYNFYVDNLPLYLRFYDYFLVVGDINFWDECVEDDFHEAFSSPYHGIVCFSKCMHMDQIKIKLPGGTEKLKFFVDDDCGRSAQVKNADEWTNLPRGTQKLEFSLDDDGRRGLQVENAGQLKNLTISGTEMIEFLSDVFPSRFKFLNIEEIELNFLGSLHHLFRGADSATPTTTSMWLYPYVTFSNLEKFRIYQCDKIKKLFPPALLQNLRNLQQLEVWDCFQIEEIIASKEEQGEGSSSTTTDSFNLPKLQVLTLKRLPELISICSGKLVCQSLHNVEIRWCEKLTNIPIPLPLPSLKGVKVFGEAWWGSVKWDDSTDKKDLQDVLSIR